MQVNLPILDELPDSFDEDVVAPASAAIHADSDSVFLEPPDEGIAGELSGEWPTSDRPKMFGCSTSRF